VSYREVTSRRDVVEHLPTWR